MLLLSILVPCYNVKQFIQQCLDSIVKQSISNFEVLLIDDGSTDGTSEILDVYKAQDSRFKIIRKSNSGYGDSMNQGLQQAQGKYVGIVEPDDWVEPLMFETLIQTAEQYDLDLVHAGYFYEKSSGAKRRKDYHLANRVIEPAKDKTPFFCEPAIWASIYRMKMLQEHAISFLPTPGAAYQDTSFSFKTMFYSKRVMLINTPLYHYRLHDGNSVSSSTKNPFAVIKECEECLNTVRKEKRLKEFSGILYQLQFYRYKWNFMRLNDEYADEFLKRWSQEWRNRNKEIPISTIKQFKKRFYAYLIIKYPKIISWYFRKKI